MGYRIRSLHISIVGFGVSRQTASIAGGGLPDPEVSVLDKEGELLVGRWDLAWARLFAGRSLSDRVPFPVPLPGPVEGREPDDEAIYLNLRERQLRRERSRTGPSGRKR